MGASPVPGLMAAKLLEDAYRETPDSEQLLSALTQVYLLQRRSEDVLTLWKQAVKRAEEERKVVPKMKDLWIDVGARDKADLDGVIRIGDCVTVELRVQPLRNNRLASPAMDDKVGLWVVRAMPMKRRNLLSSSVWRDGVTTY